MFSPSNRLAKACSHSGNRGAGIRRSQHESIYQAAADIIFANIPLTKALTWFSLDPRCEGTTKFMAKGMDTRIIETIFVIF